MEAPVKIHRRHYEALAEAARMFDRISRRHDLDSQRQAQYRRFTKSLQELKTYVSQTQRERAQSKLFL